MGLSAANPNKLLFHFNRIALNKDTREVASIELYECSVDNLPYIELDVHRY